MHHIGPQWFDSLSGKPLAPQHGQESNPTLQYNLCLDISIKEIGRAANKQYWWLLCSKSACAMESALQHKWAAHAHVTESTSRASDKPAVCSQGAFGMTAIHNMVWHAVKHISSVSSSAVLKLQLLAWLYSDDEQLLCWYNKSTWTPLQHTNI